MHAAGAAGPCPIFTKGPHSGPPTPLAPLSFLIFFFLFKSVMICLALLTYKVLIRKQLS